LTIDGQTVDVGPGEAVCIERGQIHGFLNQGSVDAKMLCIATPAVFGPAYFREIGESSPPTPAARRTWPPPRSDAPPRPHPRPANAT